MPAGPEVSFDIIAPDRLGKDSLLDPDGYSGWDLEFYGPLPNDRFLRFLIASESLGVKCNDPQIKGGDEGIEP